MAKSYIIFKLLTDQVIEVIAWIDDDTLAGPEAGYVCHQLERWGYPVVSLDEALGRWCGAHEGRYGFSCDEASAPPG
jgi:hypothetical protein